MRCLVPTVGSKSILAELLREKGHEVVELHVGEIVSVPTEIPEGTDWVAVASKNSVPELARALAVRGDADRTVKIAAVGRKTAEALRAADIAVDFLPSVATGEALHAELSALAPSARIFDFKGYENRAVAIADKIDLSAFSDAFFTCASSVDRVLSQAVGMTRCHSIGPTTSAALRRRGITEILEASEPTLEALAST